MSQKIFTLEVVSWVLFSCAGIVSPDDILYHLWTWSGLVAVERRRSLEVLPPGCKWRAGNDARTMAACKYRSPSRRRLWSRRNETGRATASAEATSTIRTRCRSVLLLGTEEKGKDTVLLPRFNLHEDHGVRIEAMLLSGRGHHGHAIIGNTVQYSTVPGPGRPSFPGQVHPWGAHNPCVALPREVHDPQMCSSGSSTKAVYSQKDRHRMYPCANTTGIGLGLLLSTLSMLLL